MAKTDILRSRFSKTDVLVGGTPSGYGGTGNSGDWKDKDAIKRKLIIAGIIIAGFFVLYLIIYFGVLSTPGFPDSSKMSLVHVDNVYRLSWKSARGKYDDHYIVKI